MKTTLPILKIDYDETTKTAKKTESEIEVNIDTSVFAEQRWEENFPQQAARETLFAYVERIIGTDGKIGKANILSSLKALFCFIESNALPDFKAFCQMFNVAESDYFNRLTDKISTVFDVALHGSVTTEKNSHSTDRP